MDPESKSQGERPEVPLLGYATPTPLVQAGDVLRDGETLVARDKAVLPERCILCNGAPEGAPVTLRFTWDASFKRTQTSTLQLRQQGTVRAYLCAAHRRRWIHGRVYGGIAIALSLAAMLSGMALGVISESSTVPLYTTDGVAMVVAGFAGMILSLFYFTLRTRTLSCRRIEAGYLYLHGASAEFLQALPQIPGPAAAKDDKSAANKHE